MTSLVMKVEFLPTASLGGLDHNKTKQLNIQLSVEDARRNDSTIRRNCYYCMMLLCTNA